MAPFSNGGHFGFLWTLLMGNIPTTTKSLPQAGGKICKNKNKQNRRTSVNYHEGHSADKPCLWNHGLWETAAGNYFDENGTSHSCLKCQRHTVISPWEAVWIMLPPTRKPRTLQRKGLQIQLSTFISTLSFWGTRPLSLHFSLTLSDAHP